MSKGDDKPDLDSLREEIDQLDQKIQGLISERVAVASDIAKAKVAKGSTVFYRPEREAQVLRRIRERNEGPLSDQQIVRLMREIMSASLAAEMPLTVAYLGPEGTYTQAAVLKHFGHAVTARAVSTIAAVFQSVGRGESHYGVVPVENSSEGVISSTLDLFLESALSVCGEVQVLIEHQLLSIAAGIGSVKRIYAHPQSFGQTRIWLANNLPDAELIPVDSNARGAIRAKEDLESACIASEFAASLYELHSLARNIQDDVSNTTRFLVIGKTAFPSSGEDKTSIVVSTKNEVGALFNLLEPLARHNVSMSRIESRPSRQGMWEYVFFMDLVGHADDKNVASVLAELEKKAAYFKLLGSYPEAVL
ncbi:MAG: prephenate dehydratase [Proteobacteria bacterium]|jgi:chorismate mutase / prephenate dehydratase|nr:prephenate dehydratase [Pseudomonadota bacterium]